MSQPPQSNILGNASLGLGIASLVLVFSIGICALVGLRQQWILVAATPLYICGATSAFLGVIGAILGIAGLFGSNRSRATAITGLLMGLGGVCLYLAVLGLFRQAG